MFKRWAQTTVGEVNMSDSNSEYELCQGDISLREEKIEPRQPSRGIASERFSIKT